MSLIPETSAETPATPTKEPMIIDTGIDNPEADLRAGYEELNKDKAPEEKAEGEKVEGEKPDWLLSKFKTPEDQAKAYRELEKKLGAFKGAPDEYDLTIPGFEDVKFADDDPLLKEFVDKSKANGISQEFMTEMLATYAQALTMNVPNTEEEMKKLGPNAQDEVQVLAQWANTNMTPEEFKTFQGLMTTADSVRLFEKIMRMSTAPDVAPPQHFASATRETEAEVRKLVGDPRYATDENFRKEVQQRMARALGVKHK